MHAAVVWLVANDLLQEHLTHFGPDTSLGLIVTISHELHAAIDQVWGGVFQCGVKVERERQHTALEEYRKQLRIEDIDAPFLTRGPLSSWLPSASAARRPAR